MWISIIWKIRPLKVKEGKCESYGKLGSITTKTRLLGRRSLRSLAKRLQKVSSSSSFPGPGLPIPSPFITIKRQKLAACRDVMASQPEMTLLARPGVINVTLKGVQKFLEGLWVGPLCQNATLCHYRKSHNWMDGGATAETRRKEMLWAAAA